MRLLQHFGSHYWSQAIQSSKSSTASSCRGSKYHLCHNRTLRKSAASKSLYLLWSHQQTFLGQLRFSVLHDALCWSKALKSRRLASELWCSAATEGVQRCRIRRLRGVLSLGSVHFSGLYGDEDGQLLEGSDGLVRYAA